MSNYINSNSQRMGLTTVEDIEKVIQKKIIISGMFDVMRTIGNTIKYSWDFNTMELKVWNISSNKAISLGSNQALIGQTQGKLAYDISKALSDGQYVAGVFDNKIDIVNDATVEAKEIQYGKSTINMQWAEFDKHIVGNIYPDLGEGKKLNQGLLDYITTIDNSVFGTSTITNTTEKKEAIYNLVTKKQASLNKENGNENSALAYVIVSGTDMENLFQSPYAMNSTSGDLSVTLERMLFDRNIITIYLSNQSDTRDYLIVTIPDAFDLYYGAEPFRKKKVIMETGNITDSFIRVFYAYNNPFIVPNFEGDIGAIINGGSTGINGGINVFTIGDDSNKRNNSKQNKKENSLI